MKTSLTLLLLFWIEASVPLLYKYLFSLNLAFCKKMLINAIMQKYGIFPYKTCFICDIEENIEDHCVPNKATQ